MSTSSTDKLRETNEIDSESKEDEDSDVKTRSELKKTLNELPIFKLDKIKKSGLNGIPLNEVVGLRDGIEVNKWLNGIEYDSLYKKEEVREEFSSQKKSKRFAASKKKKDEPLEVCFKLISHYIF